VRQPERESAVISVHGYQYNLESRTVTSNANDGNGSLRSLVDLSDNGDEIIFDLSANTIGLQSEIAVNDKSLAINGSNGSHGEIILDGGGTTRIMHFDGCGIRLSNMTLQNGFSDGLDPDGGAISAQFESDLTLDRLTFRNNRAEGLGGAVFAQVDSNLSINDSTFLNNEADAGGAVALQDSSAVILNTDFSFNSANPGTGNGGAIFGVESSFAISRSTFGHNSADGNGGAVDVQFGDPSLTGKLFAVQECNFFENTALESGGAIRLFDGTLRQNCFIANSTFFGNLAGMDHYGDGIVSNGVLSVTNSILTGNGTTDLYAEAGSIRINYSSYGSAAFAENAAVNPFQCISGVSAADVFDSSPPISDPSGALPISVTGAATLSGTLTGLGNNGHLYFMHNGNWIGGDGTALPDGVTVTESSIAQNNVSRTQTSIAYNAGAYALNPEQQSTTVTTAADTVNPFDNVITLREAVAFYSREDDTIRKTDAVGEIVLSAALAPQWSLSLDHGFRITGNDASADLFLPAAGTTLTFGNVMLNNGTLSGEGLFQFSGTTDGTARMNGADVRYDASAGQTVFAGNYGTLTLVGSGVKTLSGDIRIDAVLDLQGTSAAVLVFDGSSHSIQLGTDSLNAVYAEVLNTGFSSGQYVESWNGSTNTVTAANCINLIVGMTAERVSGTDITYGETLADSVLTARVSIRGQMQEISLAAEETLMPDVNRDSDGKIISQTLSGIAFDGIGNYRIVPHAVTLVVNPRVITVNINAPQEKSYDGTDSAQSLNGSVSGVPGQILDYAANGYYNSRNVSEASYIAYSLVLLDTSSAKASNYELSVASIAVNGKIIPLLLTNDVKVIQEKMYDGSMDAAFSGGLTNVVGEEVTLNVKFDYNSADAADAKSISAVRWELSGSETAKGNYILETFAPVAGTITPRSVTVTAHAAKKYMDEPDPSFQYTLSEPLIAGNNITGKLERTPDGEAAGIYRIIQNDLSFGSNYAIHFVEAAFTIRKQPAPDPRFPGSVNFDQFSQGLNPNFSMTRPAMENAWLAQGGRTSPTVINPWTMPYPELVSTELRHLDTYLNSSDSASSAEPVFVRPSTPLMTLNHIRPENEFEYGKNAADGEILFYPDALPPDAVMEKAEMFKSDLERLLDAMLNP